MRLWKMPDGSLQQSFKHGSDVWSVAFSFDGHWLASGCSDGKIHLWKVNGSSLQQIIQGHASNVTGVAFSSDGRWLTSGWDKAVRLWRLNTKEEDTIRGYLRWTTHYGLFAYKANLEGAKGLTANNVKLLEQHSAINTPRI